MESRKYIDIPGSSTHELPPLLVHGDEEGTPLDEVVDLAAGLVEAEDMLGGDRSDDPLGIEQRKYDLALNLAEHYRGLVAHWNWGDSILEWIRQCEITFGSEAALRNLLHPDVWPHASRSSFVNLLMEKNVPTRGTVLEKAVGLRLTFRQPPPIGCFSDQFLLYLNSPVADSAYQIWSHMSADLPALLPPDRFHFQVVEMSRQ
jgi:hypothetical protein